MPVTASLESRHEWKEFEPQNAKHAKENSGWLATKFDYTPLSAHFAITGEVFAISSDPDKEDAKPRKSRKGTKIQWIAGIDCLTFRGKCGAADPPVGCPLDPGEIH